MQIDHDRNDHPRAMLVSVSLADAPGTDGKYFTVFIPIGEIIKLKDTDRPLSGHPWLDVPDKEIIAQQISRRDHRRIKRFNAIGKYIAISAAGDRGVKSRGCRFDENGEPIVRYQYTWRDPAKYLSEADIFWLRAVNEESYRFGDALSLVAAIGEYFQRLSDRVGQASMPKKVKVRAKDRRRQIKRQQDKIKSHREERI